MQILPYLYDKEIVSEDAILRWAEEKENADEPDKVFVKQSDVFIQVYVLHLVELSLLILLLLVSHGFFFL